MAVTALNTIKNWFKTGLKPTQTQFWATWDSFWHKDEQIPQSSIQNLVSVLNAKAEKIQFDAHTTDPNAHNTLFNLKQSLSEKGEANGYAPLDEFTKIAAEYLYIVNDLITGGTDAVLSAEQGKALQVQIDAINTLLSSNDVNLDTVQEIVDAINAVQNSFDTILVNDLSTGGTTKALTAEMGKFLNDNKLDKDTFTGTAQDLADAITAEANARTAADTALGTLIADLDAELDYYQLTNNQIFVGASGPVDDSWHGKLVTFTASVTITVPSTGLRTGFNFEGIVDPSCTLNTAITAPKAWYGGYTGAAIPENSIFTFVQRSNDSNKISIYGL